MPKFTKEQLMAQALREKRGMTPERRMGEQMLDIELEMEVAPYLNYQSDKVDAKNANYIGFEGDAPKVSLAGFIGKGTDKIKRKGTVDGRYLEIYDQPKGSVNAIDKQATPRTYAHEFRHLQRPNATEGVIRAYDGYNAQNEADWKDAVLYFRDYIKANSMEKAESALLKELRLMDGKKNDSMNDNPWWKRQKNRMFPEKKKKKPKMTDKDLNNYIDMVKADAKAQKEEEIKRTW